MAVFFAFSTPFHLSLTFIDLRFPLKEVILEDFVSSVELLTVLFGAIIGSLFSELQSLKAEFMPNQVAGRSRFGLY